MNDALREPALRAASLETPAGVAEGERAGRAEMERAGT